MVASVVGFSCIGTYDRGIENDDSRIALFSWARRVGADLGKLSVAVVDQLVVEGDGIRCASLVQRNQGVQVIRPIIVSLHASAINPHIIGWMSAIGDRGGGGSSRLLQHARGVWVGGHGYFST